MGDWLGTGTIATFNIKYRTFKQASEFVHGLKLNSGAKWKLFCKSGSKPDNIPAYPNKTYKNKGWVSMGDWLGTGRVANFNKVYLSFKKAREYVRKLKLKSHKEWRQYCMSDEKPDDIPAYPNGTYKNKGWKGWGDFLGTGTIAPINIKYRTFKQAREFVHGLKLNSGAEWKSYCKSGSKTDDIPANPNRTYKNKGWVSMGDWLGAGRVANFNKVYLSFKKAREYVRKIKLKSYTGWREYCKSGNKPDDISAGPSRTFKNKGWISWGDWLGTGIISAQKIEYQPFLKAREFVCKLNLKSNNDWNKYCKSGKKPNDIPAHPNGTYKNKG